MGRAPITGAAKDLHYTLVGEYIWGKFSSPSTTSTSAQKSSRSEQLVRIYESALVFTSELKLESESEKHLFPSRDPNGLSKDPDPIVPSEPHHKCKPWFVLSNYHDIGDIDGGINSNNNNSISMHPHPCFKPFQALEPLLREWTKPGDLVLDPFAGGGGIASALKKIGERDYIGVERLPFWVDFVRKELENTGS